MGRKSRGRTREMSLLATWALAFGCALGWDAFVLPWTMFLPEAGWLGAMLGILAGGVVMGVVAWNYHYMVNRYPGPGGVYSYTSNVFGCDHGFLCTWFICLAYAAIVWADTMALGMFAHYMLGSTFHSGIGYTVAGHRVCLNCIALAIIVSALVTVACKRRHVAVTMNTVFAICMTSGIVASFAMACFRHTGGLESFGPAFAIGGRRFLQVLAVLTMSPWLFIGFEVVSNVSPSFRFSPRKSFGVMIAAIATTTIGYAMLLLILSSRMDLSGVQMTEGPDAWATVIYHAFDALRGVLGEYGGVFLLITVLGAIFTNLIGNTIAASTLLSVMAEQGALPAWFGKRNSDGSPSNAIFAITAAILLIAPLGQAVIGVVVDIALVGAVIAYAYVSAATFKLARAEGNRISAATGAAGLLFAVAIVLAFVIPGITSATATIATGSYLVVVVWCLIGLLMFLWVFRRDAQMRFGRSPVAWISLLAVILAVSVIWIRQSTNEITAKAYENVIHAHAEVCHPDTFDGIQTECNRELRSKLDAQHEDVTRSIMFNNIVQTTLTILAICIMLLLYDILRKRERKLEIEKTKAKSYFFSTVSHDIRTPLNAIIGFTEMLKMGLNGEEERKQALDAISVSSKTLLGLINDVLDLSKLEAGKMTISPEPTDCESLFRGIMDGFKISSAKPGLEFRCRVRPMPPLMLDPLRIRQIVFNLVGNAAKFTKQGHVMLHASYETQPGGDAGVFRFEVEDTGCGISDDDLKRLGGAYVQVGAAQARNGGTGLGLAICRQLTAAMGGQLSIVSELGKGSTFSIEIPGVRLARKDTKFPMQKADSILVDKGAEVRKILVVDDQKMNCMVLRAMLQHVGNFDIVTAQDGKAALDIIESNPVDTFDLVLTDLWMPNLDGEGLLKAVRANPKFSTLRIIAVTADVEFTSNPETGGFDGVLYKPVTMAKLSHIIHGEA